MSTTLRTVLCTFGAGALLVVVACSSSDDRPPAAAGPSASSASSASGSGGSTDGGSTSGDGGGDSGPRPFPERLCEPLPQQGSDVQEISQPLDRPTPAGGTLTAGTYVLTAIDFYRGSTVDPGAGGIPTGKAGRATLYVTGDGAFRFIESYGDEGSLPTDSMRGVSYVPAGTALLITPECPTPGTAAPIDYTAQGTEISLFPDATHRFAYSKLP